MKIKSVEVPEELLQLPYPWSITSNRERRQEQGKLDRTEENFENALSSIEIALAVFQNLVFLEKTSIPEELDDYWSFTAEAIARNAIQFDKLTRSSIELAAKSYGYESLSEQTLNEMAEMWIWTTVRDIIDSSLTWLSNNLDEEKNERYIKNILRISSYYWDKVPRSLAASLISVSSIFPKSESINFLEEIEKSSSITEQRELARDYRKLLLERLEKV
jgi:hypothetical protein